MSMRKSMLGLAVTAGLAATFWAGAASADPYKWCAVYGGGRDGGGTNCGFLTLAQCRDTISGVGGTCTPNPFYNGVPFGSERPVRRAHKRHRS